MVGSRHSATVVVLAVIMAPAAQAQIVTDGTVGAAVSLAPGNAEIGANLGAQVGANLFHSFSDFNVAPLSTVTFTGPAGIRNVVSRVTGAAPSAINGTLRSEIGSDGFYLINPAGLIIGPGATIDVPGTFHGSNASAIIHADASIFSSTDIAGSSLTIADPAEFGFVDPSSGSVEVGGSFILQAPGRSIDLVATEVSVENAFLATLGGDVRLQGAALGDRIPVDPSVPTAADSGAVSVDNSFVAALEGTLALGGDRLALTDLTGGNGILVRSTGAAGNGLRAEANQIVIDNAEIAYESLDFGTGGGLSLHANERFEITNASSITTFSNAISVAGDIAVSSGGTLLIDDFSSIESDTQSIFPGANIELEATELALADSLITATSLGFLFAGRGGNIALDFDDARLTDSIIETATLTIPGGDVTLTGKALEIEGGFFSLVGGEASIIAGSTFSGPAGNVTIDVASIALGPGAGIDVVSERFARAGQISISGDSLATAGTNADPVRIGALIAAGDAVIDLTSNTTSLGADTAILVNAESGDLAVTIEGDEFHANEGAEIFALASTGESNLSIRADDVNIAGFFVVDTASTTGENFVIEADDFHLLPTGGLSTSSSFGEAAGGIRVTAERARFDGIVNASSGGVAGLSSFAGGQIVLEAEETLSLNNVVSTLNFADFAGGLIRLDAPLIVLGDGGLVSAAALGSGDGGDVIVTADSLTLTGESELDSSTTGAGAGGNVTIDVSTLTVGEPGEDGGAIITALSARAPDSPPEIGKAGAIDIDADAIVVDSTGAISATTNAGPGGNVFIDTNSLTIVDGGSVTAETGGANPGGRVEIDADNVTISGAGSTLSTASFFSTGPAGNLVLEVGDLSVLDGAGILTTSDNASGGEILVTSTGLILIDQAVVGTSVFDGAMNGGDITIDGRLIALARRGRISANAVLGNGGAISIATDALFRSGGTVIEATSTLGIDGEITIDGLENPDTATVVALPSDFLAANAILPNPCLAALLGRSELNLGRARLTAGGVAPEAPPGLFLDVIPYPHQDSPAELEPSSAAPRWAMAQCATRTQ